MKDDNSFLEFEVLAKTVDKMYPVAKEKNNWDYGIELLKIIKPSTIGEKIQQAMEATIKMYSELNSSKIKGKTVKYLKDAYEVKCQSEVEIARINEKKEMDKAVVLYIEKAYQEKVDKINKDIILSTHELDVNHEKDMKELQYVYQLNMKKIESITKEHMHTIDVKYAGIINENEKNCIIYRKYIKSMMDENVSKVMLMSEISKQYMEIVKRANEYSGNMEIFDKSLDALYRLLDFTGNTNYLLPFEEFIERQSQSMIKI